LDPPAASWKQEQFITDFDSYDLPDISFLTYSNVGCCYWDLFLIPTFVFLALACGRQVCNAFLKENLVLIGLKNPHSTKGEIANLPAAGRFHQPIRIICTFNQS
jgi:hypothetical protein